MTSCIIFSILIAVTCSPDILFTAGELDRFEALTKDAVIVGDAEGGNAQRPRESREKNSNWT